MVTTMMTPTKSVFAVLAIVFFSVAVASFFIGPGYVDSHSIDPNTGPEPSGIEKEFWDYNGLGSNIWDTNGDAKDMFFGWLA